MDVLPGPDPAALSAALQRAQWVIDMAFEQNSRLRAAIDSMNAYTSTTAHRNNVNNVLLDCLQDEVSGLISAAEKEHDDCHGTINILACTHAICVAATRKRKESSTTTRD